PAEDAGLAPVEIVPRQFSVPVAVQSREDLRRSGRFFSSDDSIAVLVVALGEPVPAVASLARKSAGASDVPSDLPKVTDKDVGVWRGGHGGQRPRGSLPIAGRPSASRGEHSRSEPDCSQKQDADRFHGWSP